MQKMITEQQIRKSMFNQISSEVHERNVYRKLLEECLFNLNQLETINMNSLTKYRLATKIEQTFEKYDHQF